jgi:hypothetical protein
MTSTVERHDPVPLRQRVTERIQQQVAVGHPAMQQQHRLDATAALVDPGWMPIDFDALAHAIPPLASILPARLYGRVHSSYASATPRDLARRLEHREPNNRGGGFTRHRGPSRPEQRDRMTSMTSPRPAQNGIPVERGAVKEV